MEKKSGVYVIENQYNENLYVGFSTDLDRRFRVHFKSLRENKHYNKFLQEDYNKGDDFIFKVIESTQDKEREKHYINLFKDKCYNSMLSDGESFSHNDETKSLISKNLKGKFNHNGENNPNFGNKISDTAKEKISSSLKEKYANGYVNPMEGKKREAGNIKLSLEDAIEIKKPLLENKTCKYIADKFNISQHPVKSIRQGKHKYSEKLGGSLKDWRDE